MPKPIDGPVPPSAEWQEIDAALLEEGRGGVPAFPVDRLPTGWRDWVSDTARAAGAPADYVAQALLGVASGLCGAGVLVQVMPGWREPMVLWQALVGRASSGRSPALASTRRLLATVEAETSQCAVHDSRIGRIADVVLANTRRALLWCDEPCDWLAPLLNERRGERRLWLQAWSADPGEPEADQPVTRLTVGIIGSVQPERLGQMLRHDDDLAARFLFSWPHQPPYVPFADRKPANDDLALKRLRRLPRKAGTGSDPLLLIVDRRGLAAFDVFMARLHASLRDAEGREAAWLGKGGSTVARLAGILEMLDWAATGSASPPGHIGRERIEDAAELWEGYFRPHAKALFTHSAPTDLEYQARRVARWLRSNGLQEITREEVRRNALGRTVNAIGADRVLYRLRTAGIVRLMPLEMRAQGGRPANRWEVNPALGHA